MQVMSETSTEDQTQSSHWKGVAEKDAKRYAEKMDSVMKKAHLQHTYLL